MKNGCKNSKLAKMSLTAIDMPISNSLPYSHSVNKINTQHRIKQTNKQRNFLHNKGNWNYSVREGETPKKQRKHIK